MFTTLANPGLVEVAALTTMGVNVKDNAEESIGYFGTGFKYAIAQLLRTGHKVTVWRGTSRYEFFAVEELIRGKKFSIVHMKGPDGAFPLGFSTDLGKNWELWMSFRELYSNMLDETGAMRFSEHPPAPTPGTTLVVVEGSEFHLIAKNKHTIFLEGEPIHQFLHSHGTHRNKPFVNIHKGKSDQLYVKGVRAFTLESESVLTWNFLSPTVVLTEDRTVRDVYVLRNGVGQQVCEHLLDKDLLKAFVTAKEGSFEYGIDIHWGSPTAEIIEVISECIRKRGNGSVTPSALLLWTAHRKQKAAATELELNEMQDAAWDRATIFLEAAGYKPSKFTFKFVEDLGDGNDYEIGFDAIKIAAPAFSKGKAHLAAMLLTSMVKFKTHNSATGGPTDVALELATIAVSTMQKLQKDYL